MSNCKNDGFSFPNADQAKLIARRNDLIFTEICAIQQALISAMNQCNGTPSNGCVVIGGSTPMTFVGGIQTVTIDNGGADYIPVSARVDFLHPNPVDSIPANRASATLNIVNGSITQINMTSGGSLYTPIIAQYTITTALGSGAVIDLLINDSGQILGAEVVTPGTQYAVGDQIVVSHAFGTGAQLVVGMTASPSGGIMRVDVVNQGTGYQPVYPTVIVTHHTGVGFSGEAVVNGAGEIVGVNILNNGYNYYDIMPTVSISDAAGAGATIEVVGVDYMSGEITDLQILSSGADYTTAIQLGANPVSLNYGSGAQIYANVDGSGAITSLILVAGGTGYTPGIFTLPPENAGVSAELLIDASYETGEITSVTVWSGGTLYTAGTKTMNPVTRGTGALLSATVLENPYDTEPTEYYTAYNNTTDNKSLKDEVTQVISYFKSKGYSVSLVENQDTAGTTFLWKICWV